MKQVLIDTSIWIEHFKSSNNDLLQIIDMNLNNKIIIRQHEMIVGELMIGGIPNRTETLDLLSKFHYLPRVKLSELQVFIDNNKLVASGITYVDVNILASCLLERTLLLTNDLKLRKAAKKLALLYA